MVGYPATRDRPLRGLAPGAEQRFRETGRRQVAPLLDRHVALRANRRCSGRLQTGFWEVGRDERLACTYPVSRGSSHASPFAGKGPADQHEQQYRDRYQLIGSTLGGRKLKIIFQMKRNNVVRIITGWPL